MTTTEGVGLDTSDLDRYMGVPMEPGELKEPVAVNDIRRWVQAMHYPNPLHYDEDWAAEGRFGRIVAPQSFTVACDTSHGCSPAQVGRIPNSHLIFGGDEWWFFGPRVEAGDHLVCHRMPYDYRVTDTKFAGPTCFQRGDTLYINQLGERVAQQRSTSIRYQVREAKEKHLFDEAKTRSGQTSSCSSWRTSRPALSPRSRSCATQRTWESVEVGHELAVNVLGPHSLASFATEWRAYPMTTWGATRKGPDHCPGRGARLHQGDGRLRGRPQDGAVNPELTDGAYYGRPGPSPAPVGPPRRHGSGLRIRRLDGRLDAGLRGGLGRRVGLHHPFAAQYRNPAFTGDATFIRGEVTDKRVEAAAPSRHGRSGADQSGQRHDGQGHGRGGAAADRLIDTGRRRVPAGYDLVDAPRLFPARMAASASATVAARSDPAHEHGQSDGDGEAGPLTGAEGLGQPSAETLTDPPPIVQSAIREDQHEFLPDPRPTRSPGLEMSRSTPARSLEPDRPPHDRTGR